MEKYIGNKRKILDEIDRAIRRIAGGRPATLIDIFAGTNNVGKYFKSLGTTVYSNDLNSCSYALARAYIANNQIPSYSKVVKRYGLASACSEDDLAWFAKVNGNGKTKSPEHFLDTEAEGLYLLLTFLSLPKSPLPVINKVDPSFTVKPVISKYYAPGGSGSHYIDRRTGKTKSRMFFTDIHALRIDLILSVLNFWRKERIITGLEFDVLLATLIHAASLFSNTSGVYEAFYKKWFPNTRQPFRLPIPDIEAIESGPRGSAFQKDAIQAVREMPRADVLYVDPPYNSRQYGSNYHLLNLIAKYHELKDWRTYQRDIENTRGQNMSDNYRSPFSSRRHFESAMRELVKHSPAKYIVISHFDGDDNLWKSPGNREGIAVLRKILTDRNVFVENSFRLYRAQRQNFQSRRGRKKKMLNELLFCAEKIR